MNNINRIDEKKFFKPCKEVRKRVHSEIVQKTHCKSIVRRNTFRTRHGGEAPIVDTPTGLEIFYNVVDTVILDVDQQLATIVNNLTKNRLPEEKLKEKLATYDRPGTCECEGLTVTRVNPDIWEKLSSATTSHDLKAQ